MSRPDISCHPSVALDVEFEIWDVKPSRNILLRVSYQCSIAPPIQIFQEYGKGKVSIRYCCVWTAINIIDPSRKTGVQGELIGGETGMNFIGYAWQNCDYLGSPQNRTNDNFKVRREVLSPPDLHNYSSISSWDKMYRVKSVLRYLTLVPTIFRLNGK